MHLLAKVFSHTIATPKKDPHTKRCLKKKEREKMEEDPAKKERTILAGYVTENCAYHISIPRTLSQNNTFA